MSDNKPKIGVVGAGHLGRHHIKHLSQHSGVEFVGVFDVNKESLRSAVSYTHLTLPTNREV